MLVPIFGTSVDTVAMARAAAIAGPDAAVEAVYMLEVPTDQRLDCNLDEEEDAARTVATACSSMPFTAAVGRPSPTKPVRWKPSD